MQYSFLKNDAFYQFYFTIARTQLINIIDVHESFGESFDRTEDVQRGT